MKEGHEQFFLHTKPVNILTKIREMETPYNNALNEEISTTSSHLNKIVGELEEMGLISKEKSSVDPRRKDLKLTKLGEAYAEKLEELKQAGKK